MAGELHLVVNGRRALARVAPRLAGDTVMVPARAAVESCGGTVEYLPGPPARVVIMLGGSRSEAVVGENQATAGTRLVPLPAPPVIVEDTMLVPAEVLRPLGIEVEVAEPARACLCGCRDSRLRGRRIFLDPGHGGSDPGAIGPGGTREAAVTLDVAQQTARLLGMAGAVTSLSRTSDRKVSLERRLAAAETRRTEVFLSIHANSFTDQRARGTETYYYETWESQKLASAVQQELVEELGLADRGVKEASYYVLRHARMPACLTELAFLSSPDEEALLADAWFRLRAALALFRGIRTFMDSAAARLA
ncbi:MAG: N-acetylmuramoyl-L-alanine amidase [Bacillota bacterium]|nr:N-acetylmuramoyl-L-alanine amidase [Bacillota bacterium]